MAGEKIKIQLLAESGTLSELTALCAPLGIEHCTESPLALAQTKTHLALRKLDEPWRIVVNSAVVVEKLLPKL